MKSPVTQVSEKCYLDTFSRHENATDEKSKKNYSDQHFMHDSLKFEAKNYSVAEKFSHPKDFSEKSSTKIENNFSEPKKYKRERNLKSPKFLKNNLDGGMNINSFSSRTIEESSSSKQIFLDNKIHLNKDNNKLYIIDLNPILKTSNKHIKVVFKNYSKIESLVSHKNTSQEENQIYSKNVNSETEISGDLDVSLKNSILLKERERSKINSISSASSVKTFESFQRNIIKNEVLAKTKTVKEYEIKDQVPNIEDQSNKLEPQETKLPVDYRTQIGSINTPRGMDDTLSSIFTSIEENSV